MPKMAACLLVAKVTLDRETFKALASETRLSLLRSLDERRKTGSELARDLDLNKATVHEHLQLLENVGLVKKVDEGRKWIYWELSWDGRKLLHPETGATFAVLLSLSVLSAGGVVAMLGRAWDWWSWSRTADDGAGSDEPQMEGFYDAAPAADGNGTRMVESDLAAMDDADASGGADFWDDGGMLGLVLLALTALLLGLAFLLRFRGTRKS